MLKTNKKAYLFYIGISLFLILISLIGVFFNVYEALIVTSLSSLAGLIVLALNLKDQDKTYEESAPHLGSFLLVSFFRFLAFALALIGSGIIIYFLNPEGEKARFLYLLIGLIFVFLNGLTFYLRNLK